jgi:hypothetical protein
MRFKGSGRSKLRSNPGSELTFAASSTKVRSGPKMAIAQRMMGNGRSLTFRIDSNSENPFRDEVKHMSEQLK